MSDTDLLLSLLLVYGIANVVVGVWLLGRAPLARAWLALRRAASVNPYTPRATLLQSADGSITLARLANGELRSLKRKPRGKALRKSWRRLQQRLRAQPSALPVSVSSPSS